MGGDTGIGEQGDVFEDIDADTGNQEPLSIIDQKDWTQVAFKKDPFEPPDDATCDAQSGIGAETLDGEDTLAVLTGFCAWATLVQQSTLPLKKGDILNLRIWHFELTGEGPAHVKLRIGEWVFFEKEIQKPHKAQLIAESIVVPFDFDIGSQIYFHVDNHGANEYSLVELSKN